MKKAFAAAAAVVAGVAMSAPAAAEVSISGSFTEDLGFGSYRGGAEAQGDVYMESDVEIHFKASGTTDGGIGIGVRVELEGAPGAGSNSVDETQISFSGDFGKITLGNEDSAAVTHGYVGIGGFYGGGGYYDGGDTHTVAGAGNAYPEGYGDKQRVIYSFPSMGGLSLGISFAPDSSTDQAATDANNTGEEVSVGATFSADLGGASLSIGGGVNSSTEADDGTKLKGSSGAGVSVGFGDTTLNLRSDRNSESERKSLGFGIDHSLGALTIGVGYGVGTDANDNDTSILNAGVSYGLGGGLSVSAAVNRGSVENYTAADGTVGDEDSTGFGLRLGFSF